MNREEFRNKVRRVHDTRHVKITNSYGGNDAYKWYRQNIEEDPKEAVTLLEYLKIIRLVNNHLRNLVAAGEEIKFPEYMGVLELKKRPAYISVKDGKVKTNLLIDWDKTLDLWAEDEDCYNNRQVVRHTDPYRFRVVYNKDRAKYNNKTYYQFSVNRDLKRILKENIRNHKVDAFVDRTDFYER